MASGNHPTKDRLIQVTVNLLDKKLPHEISVDEILQESGISKGSLYHHFEDLNELLEAALVFRYARWVDGSIAMLIDLVASAKSRKELSDGLKKVTRVTQNPIYAHTRYERARAIALAENSPRLRQALSIEQKRLTDALTDLIEEARNKGLYSTNFDAHAGAVLVQAYTLGRIVDDFGDDHMDEDAWYQLIDLVVDRIFLVQE